MVTDIKIAATTVTMFTASLSYIFLKSLLNEVTAKRTREQHPGTRILYRPAAGALMIASAVWIVTSSISSATSIAVMYFAIWMLITMWYRNHQNKRKNRIIREFPVLLDYLVFQVESGHSVQQALMSARTLLVRDGPLYYELREMDNSIRSGLSIVGALDKCRQSLDNEDVSVPMQAISQAIQHGTPLRKTLREQSIRMRQNLILQGEEFANTVSVKILIPLLFFIFPASFLVIFSPVIVSLSGRLP